LDLLKQSSPTRESLGLLAVMDVLEQKQGLTQRELAEETGLNLKKVNYCLHKLLEKGHLKFQKVRRNPDKRSYLYILTPSGMKLKSQLTYRFLKFTLDYYSQVENRIRRSVGEMTEAGVGRILLFGVSDMTRIVIGLLNEGEIRVAAIIDENPQLNEYMGYPVRDIAETEVSQIDAVLVTSLDEDHDAEALCRLGLEEDRIWRVS
jgi:EPS-associated MarR family transcriptional regulator